MRGLSGSKWSNQRASDVAVGGPPIIPNDADAVYTGYKRGNDAIIADLLDSDGSGRQTPKLSANAAEFQPSPSFIVGDQVSGMPADGFSAQSLEAVAGGASINVSGVDWPNDPSSPPQHPGVSDWPNVKGSGTLSEHDA